MQDRTGNDVWAKQAVVDQQQQTYQVGVCVGAREVTVERGRHGGLYTRRGVRSQARAVAAKKRRKEHREA